MERLRVTSAVLAVMLCLPAISAGQWLPTFEPWDGGDYGAVHVSTSAGLGYQRMRVNLSLPIALGNRPLLRNFYSTSALDLELPDVGIWIGRIHFEARRGALSLFVTAEGNASKDVTVKTPSEPFAAGHFPVEWKGAGLEWWAVGGGGAVSLGSDFDLVGGLRIEHLSLGLEDPVDPLGNFDRLENDYGDRCSGDLLTKLWIPYFGIRFDGLNYKASLLFSPIAMADVKIPFRFLTLFFEHGRSFIGQEDARYNFSSDGLWLEGDLQYAIRVRGNLACNLWFKGSYLQIQGEGKEEYESVAEDAGVPEAPIYDSGSADGSYTAGALAGGLSASWTF